MSPRYDEAPELAPHNYPEVHHPPAEPEVSQYQDNTAFSPMKPADPSTTASPGGYFPHGGTTAASTSAYDQSGYATAITSERGKGGRRVMGCSVLVLILSLIIALLSAAVIGLAAGTGVEASRANNAESRLASMSASGGSPTTVTVTAPSATATDDFSSIDRGCSSNSSGVTGTQYFSHFYNQPTFTIYCNSNPPNNPLQSLFVGNFDDCMDACASWSSFTPDDFNSTSTNTTCAAVGFIPEWTNRTTAVEGTAPGNCYLKPGPQSTSDLESPNIGGGAVHAALLQTES